MTGCLTRILAAVCVITIFMAGIAQAQNSAQRTGKEQIRISAKSLEVDNAARFAEFAGNVRAVQGNTVITSQSLKIFYKASGEASAETEEGIERIVAKGNVRITFDDRVAETDQATYTTADRVLTLSGPGSKITSQKDSVSGSKIIFYRNETRVKVESNGDMPVEAVIYPGDKGID